MGEIADAIINGEICQECMVTFIAPIGIPVSCHDCDFESPYHDFIDDALKQLEE